jgi:hypothetical protein
VGAFIQLEVVGGAVGFKGLVHGLVSGGRDAVPRAQKAEHRGADLLRVSRADRLAVERYRRAGCVVGSGRLQHQATAHAETDDANLVAGEILGAQIGHGGLNLTHGVAHTQFHSSLRASSGSVVACPWYRSGARAT